MVGRVVQKCQEGAWEPAGRIAPALPRESSLGLAGWPFVRRQGVLGIRQVGAGQQPVMGPGAVWNGRAAAPLANLVGRVAVPGVRGGGEWCVCVYLGEETFFCQDLLPVPS